MLTAGNGGPRVFLRLVGVALVSVAVSAACLVTACAPRSTDIQPLLADTVCVCQEGVICPSAPCLSSDRPHGSESDLFASGELSGVSGTGTVFMVELVAAPSDPELGLVVRAYLADGGVKPLATTSESRPDGHVVLTASTDELDIRSIAVYLRATPTSPTRFRPVRIQAIAGWPSTTLIAPAILVVAVLVIGAVVMLNRRRRTTSRKEGVGPGSDAQPAIEQAPSRTDPNAGTTLAPAPAVQDDTAHANAGPAIVEADGAGCAAPKSVEFLGGVDVGTYAVVANGQRTLLGKRHYFLLLEMGLRRKIRGDELPGKADAHDTGSWVDIDGDRYLVSQLDAKFRDQCHCKIIEEVGRKKAGLRRINCAPAEVAIDEQAHQTREFTNDKKIGPLIEELFGTR
jgi:hypothetical protein